ncbi:MAG: alkaline phosphatase family protein [Phycisphaerae bacterium]|nr:alkaline phosphatase family protein [Phycisphaerae bacterium]
MKRAALVLLAALFALLSSAVPARSAPPRDDRPRLVVLVVIDGLGYERLMSVRDNFAAKGAFHKMLDSGAVYTNCHHRHAFTETAVGHATMLTGAYPSANGIVGNSHWDRELDDIFPAVWDPTSLLVGLPAGFKQPMYKIGTGEAATSQPAGMSPRNLLAATVGDMLKLSTQKKARVFGLSAKDRAAILTAGHAADGAFWFNSKSGNWITSRHYMAELPAYLTEFNRSRGFAAWAEKTWTPLLAKDKYRTYRDDDYAYEEAWPFTAGFPHEITTSSPKAYSEAMLTSPYGNEMILDVARMVIQKEQLGVDDVPDLLAVSFSCNDYVHHGFGPFSLEAQDMTLRTDLMIGELAAALDRQCKGAWTMVVTADHGFSESPEWLEEFGLPAARGALSGYDKLLEAKLVKAFGEPADKRSYIMFASGDEVFLRRDLPELAGEKYLQAQRVVRDALLELKPVVAAYTRETLLATGATDGLLAQLRRTFYPRLSGDVLFVTIPSNPQSTTPANHGTPWPHDTHVPLMLLGEGIKPGRFTRDVCPTDIAPTLSRLLDIPAPTSCQAEALHEAIGE